MQRDWEMSLFVYGCRVDSIWGRAQRVLVAAIQMTFGSSAIDCQCFAHRTDWRLRLEAASS